MFEAIGSFFNAVRAVLSLNAEAIGALQQSPNALGLALTIIILAGFAEAIGNSPVIFLNRLSIGRFIGSLAVATVLAYLRFAIWIVALTLFVALLLQRWIPFEIGFIVVGLGLAPMLLSVFVFMPGLGLFIQAGLRVWTFLAVTVSIGVSLNLSIWPAALAVGLVGWLVAMVFSRTIDRWIVRGTALLMSRVGVHDAAGLDEQELVERFKGEIRRQQEAA